jgi:alkylation response protein AidB-like acyl-CoA dehydrogenase
VPIDLELPAPAALLAETARDLLERRYSLAAARAAQESESGFDAPLWEEARKLGWLDVPAAMDGSGLLAACTLLGEFGRARAVLPYTETVVALGLTAARFHLPHVHVQQHASAILGDDAGVLNGQPSGLLATSTADGHALSGHVSFAPFVQGASTLLVKAERLGGEPALFLAEAQGDGLEARRMRAVAPTPYFEATLSDLPARLLVEGSEAVQYCEDVVTVARCAEMVGGCERVLDQTLNYAKDRVQFGQPIGSFQAIQNRFASLVIDLDITRMMVHDAAWRLDAGEAAVDALSTLRLFCGSAVERICTEGHHINGAMSLTEEYGLEFISRRAYDLRLALGPTSQHAIALADRLAASVNQETAA